MFGTKERAIIAVNDDPRVVAARENTRAARIEADKQAEDEQRLREILEPPWASSTTTPKDITDAMLREANTRLLPRRIGVSDVRFCDTREGNAARTALRAAQAQETAIRDAVRQELEQQVKARAKALCHELEDALKPCHQLARDLLALQEDSGLTVPVLPSLLPGGSLEHEIPLLRNWTMG